MGFIKPTVGPPPKPTNANQNRGKTVNAPTYLEMGGFTGPSKLKKNKMAVEKPESGGPFRKV